MYYVILKDTHRLNDNTKEMLIDLELDTHEERFPFDSNKEVYTSGSKEECEQFIANIKDDNLKIQFKSIEITNN